ncbi:hypothetical protein BDV93DRAFT_244329 [Ceratobasidium sp. AG-I]|nr:hypothetical protein BDV93DRAFT_244329 [Ceratobasidium sp. AG-I]
MSYDLEGLRNNVRLTPMARDIFIPLTLVGADFWEEALHKGRSYQNINLTSFNFFFRLDQNMTTSCLSESLLVSPDRIWPSWDCMNIGNALSVNSNPAFQNYLRLLSSSILCDLGATPQQNILTNSDSFKNWISNIGTTQGPHINKILANMSEFNLPLHLNQTTRLNTQYLCHHISWKPRTVLLADEGLGKWELLCLP